MSPDEKSSRISLAPILGVLGFVLSVVSLGWQVHVQRESLTDKALVRFSFSLLLDSHKDILSVTKTAKHLANMEIDQEPLKKAELDAEVVNIGQRPLYVKRVRLVVPCPETGDSESITLQPAKGSPTEALEPGAAAIYKASPWNLLEHPLAVVHPPEPFCVTVESNKGLITQTSEIAFWSYSMDQSLKSLLTKQRPTP